VGLHLFAHAALPIPTDFAEVNPDALGSRVEKLEVARRDSAFVPIDRAHLDSLSAQVGPDVEEVVNYVSAIESGLSRLATLPLSTRLIREMRAVILDGVLGRDRQPGEFRTSQNWIGAPGATIETATFVPPLPSELAALRTLADLGILSEAADGPRGQLRWRASEILDILIAELPSSG